MKEMFSKFLPKTKKERVILTIIMVVALAMCAMVVPVTAITAGSMVGKLVDVVCEIFLYIGILLSVWAVGMLVLAFKNEDADSKSRAMMLLIVAVMLITINQVVSRLGLIDLITENNTTSNT